MRVFWLDLERLRKRLKKTVRRLAARHPEIEEVWLFGSLARGEAVPGSGADLLVVLKDCPLPFLERAAYYQPDFCGVGTEVFAYTSQELAVMEAANHSFLGIIQPDRLCLYRRSSSGTGKGT